MKTKNQHENYFFEGGSKCIIPLNDGKKWITINIERIRKESAQSMLNRLDEQMKKEKCVGLIQWFFGGIHPKTRAKVAAIQKYVSKSDVPTLWLNGDGNEEPALTAIQVCGMSGIKPQHLSSPGGCYRKWYKDDYGSYHYIGGAIGLGATRHKTPEQQTEAAFEAIRALCRMDGATTFKNVARTWIYLDQLLTWYTPFNNVRTAFFNKLDLFDNGMIPSSTGIGAINADETMINLSAFAVNPSNKKVSFTPVRSPLQCPADDYRSSFSRAHLIQHPYYRQLLISGTASILQGGASAHVGDIEAQIELTMQVVKAMFDDNKFTWNDVNRAICYFKDLKDVKAFYEWLEKNEINEFPAICVQVDVCRDELLFEIELDAIVAR